MAAAKPHPDDCRELAPDEQTRRLAEAERDYRHERAQLEAELYAARERRDHAIREAAQAGMSYRQIAHATGLSHQRVAQIVAEG